MDDSRQSPEQILKRVQAEELQKKRGKFKIYLGAAPGVGKTYTMLQDAHQKVQQGVDVVVGVVESHGREDTERLVKDFEVLPLKKVPYKGKELEEFDLDGALERCPGLLLIDELAHANVPGLRHEKRWQDVKEILDRGIDVYTTLNVQHIESLNNDVSGIIHAPIKETVPDSMLDLADTIELVDLPPEDLLKRLQDGKVYYPAQADIAKDKFFRKGNLIALRELALRVTAERVGAQVLLYRQGQHIQHIWSSSEKILVCVGSGQESQQLIRAARRLASGLQASWMAVYVESQVTKPKEQDRNNAIKNLRLAEQLGAQTAILPGVDLVKEIISYAREQNVTLIMVWKHIVPRWQSFWRRHLSDEILRKSAEINVYIITGSINEPEQNKPHAIIKTVPLSYVYLLSVILVAVTTIVCFLLYKYFLARNLSLVFLASVIGFSLLGRIGPSLLAAVLSAFSYYWFFYPGILHKSIGDIGALFFLILVIVLVQVISNLTFIARRQADAARSAERKATALNRLSQQLASARGITKLLEIGAAFIAEFFSSDVMVLMPEDQELVIKYAIGSERALDTKELAVAQWVFDLGQVAGLGTDTLSQTNAIYVPLLASKGVMGVLSVKPQNPENLFTPEQMHFLEVCANQLALTMEVDQLQEQRKQIELEQEIDHTRNVLLQSVSQDLRAPLAAIMLTASTQMQMAGGLTPHRVQAFGQNIYNETEQLSRLINNLLQITYLESNSVKLQKEPSSLIRIVEKIIKASRAKLAHTPVYIQIPPEIPMIPFDKILIEGVFINLLDNALKFAPQDQVIEISASLGDGKVIVSVGDRGPGIYGDEVSRLFEKFYRGRMLTTKRGLGLGLAICRMIIEAHGGIIWAENRDGGGAVFKFTLPVAG